MMRNYSFQKKELQNTKHNIILDTLKMYKHTVIVEHITGRVIVIQEGYGDRN